MIEERTAFMTKHPITEGPVQKDAQTSHSPDIKRVFLTGEIMKNNKRLITLRTAYRTYWTRLENFSLCLTSFDCIDI